MADFKVVFGLKDGKCVQQEFKDEQGNLFLGKKIGEKLTGDSLGLKGYEFVITGGSDAQGFPMRKDVDGSKRKRILGVKGVGIKPKRKGQKQRKTIAGNTIHEAIAQINVKVLKEGTPKLGAAAETPAEEEAKSEEKKEEKPAEEKKE